VAYLRPYGSERASLSPLRHRTRVGVGEGRRTSAASAPGKVGAASSVLLPPNGVNGIGKTKEPLASSTTAQVHSRAGSQEAF
jgi:hypothetical protein